jgi:hypothetical protein
VFQSSGTAVPSGSGRAPATAERLSFQRCRWCGTASYRRLLCSGCGSTEFDVECSEGEGAVCAHRDVSAVDDRWPVVMREGFVVLCRVRGPRGAVRPGVRVRLSPADAIAPEPVVELRDPPPDDHWAAVSGHHHRY